MRSRFVVAWSCALATLALLSSSPSSRAEADAAWVARMTALSTMISTILPDALDPEPLNDERRLRLRGQAKALTSLAHDLSKLAPRDRPDRDPTLPLLLRELERTAQSLDRVSDDRLRDVALAAASACIACHTRTDRGPAMPRFQPPPVDPRLPLHVRADVFAATRRFPDARQAYADAVKDEAFAGAQPLLWERAVKRGLALEVRVARDPKAALVLVDAVLATSSAESLWPDASAWRESLLSWQRESERRDEPAFRQAARLMNAALGQQRVPADQSADVTLLRATAHLHDVLADNPKGLERAQALSWLGQAYESLRDVDIWSLWLLYDEACVHAAPHTGLAETCYARWERGMLEEHSGNSGMSLPPEVQARARELFVQAARERSVTRPIPVSPPSP